jgi:hypothetical protein
VDDVVAEVDIDDLDLTIQQMRQITEELKEKAGKIQAVAKNVDRILVSIKMLELSISEVTGFL